MPRSNTPPAAFNAASEYQHIPLTPVSSNQIAAIGYDAARSTLALTFARGPGNVYHYPNFSAESFAALQAADSKGTFFGKHIQTLPFSKFESSVLEGQQDQADTPATIAALLHGREYAARDAHITDEAQARALAAGILIVCGASDDLVEFYGAWRDEEGAYNGTTLMLDAKGVLPSWEQIQDDGDESRHADYHARKPHVRTIEALWAPEEPEGASWAYKTDIPHSTFDIMEDGEIYCRGICFALADLTKA